MCIRDRLYRFHLKEESPKAIDMLCRQGRMHPGVAFFPNKAFYAGRLEALGSARALLALPLRSVRRLCHSICDEKVLHSVSTWLAGRGIFVQRVTTWRMEYGKN